MSGTRVSACRDLQLESPAVGVAGLEAIGCASRRLHSVGNRVPRRAGTLLDPRRLHRHHGRRQHRVCRNARALRSARCANQGRGQGSRMRAFARLGESSHGRCDRRRRSVSISHLKFSPSTVPLAGDRVVDVQAAIDPGSFSKAGLVVRAGRVVPSTARLEF